MGKHNQRNGFPAWPRPRTADSAAAVPAHTGSGVACAAATDSLAERLDPRRLRHEAWRRWQEAMPFWLSSLILHLVCFLLITSMTCPWSGTGQMGSTGISLTISFGDADQSRGQAAVVIAAETPDRESTPAPQPVTPEPPATPTRELAQQPPRGTTPQRAAAQPSGASQDQASRGIASVPLGRAPSPYAGLLARNRVSHRAPARTTPSRPISGWSDADAPRDESDRIVDAFIAYDVGELRGAAGQAAHRQFMALGPEGVPAVVRGLNKAARLHASCPVGVLASKLISLLQRMRDPSLSQYAIDHLGRDVPENAPHYQRIIALRDRWLRNLGGSAESAAQVVAEHGLQQDGELVELVLALTDAPGETLLAAVQSRDQRLRDAALLALIQNRFPLNDRPRRAIVRELTQLDHASSPATLRLLAQSALQAVRRQGPLVRSP